MDLPSSWPASGRFNSDNDQLTFDLPSFGNLSASSRVGRAIPTQADMHPAGCDLSPVALATLFDKNVAVGASAKADRPDESYDDLNDLESTALSRLLPDLDAEVDASHPGLGSHGRPAPVGRLIRRRGGSVEDDIFSAVGGLELGHDTDVDTGQLDRLLEASADSAGADVPSRTLLVKNVNPEAPEDELRQSFQAHGDVRQLYMACKHRGLVSVSFYDLRSSVSAYQSLHGSVVHGSKLEVQFSPSKQGSADTTSHGTVVVYNLDPETTNEQLVWIFSKFGEVKEIRESPTRKNQKFIEFYDTRHAAAAMKAMNRAELSGKSPPPPHSSLSLPPVLPSGLSPGTLDRHLPMAALPGAAQGSMDSQSVKQAKKAWEQQGDALYTMLNPSPALQVYDAKRAPFGHTLGFGGGLTPSTDAKVPEAGVKLSAPAPLISLPTRVPGQGMHVSDSASSIASQSANSLSAPGQQFFPPPGSSPGLINSLHQLGNVGSMYGSPSFASQSVSQHDAFLQPPVQHMLNSGLGAGLGLTDPAAQAAMAANVMASLGYADSSNLWANQLQALQAAGQFGSPALWQNPMLAAHSAAAAAAAAATAAGLGLPGNLALSDIQRQQQQFALGLAQLQAQNFSAQNLAANLNAAQFLQSAAALGNPAAAALAAGSTNYLPRSVSLSNAAQLLGSQQGGIGPVQYQNLGMKSASTPSLSSSAERQRDQGRGGRLSRRNADPMAEAERKAQQDKLFALDRDRIMSGEDKRTTLMVKNIPNKYTQKMLLATVDEQMRGTFDFFYLPIDFKNKCNVGYAFINMTKPQHIVPLVEKFNNKKWERFNSEKVCSISYARIQGRAALVAHFQNSSLMHEDKRCRPVLFQTDGPEAGEQEPFPVGPNVRARVGHGFKEGKGKDKEK